jgi:hypothetical protein
MSEQTFVSLRMIEGYIKCKDDPNNRIYRIKNGIINIGNTNYSNANYFCMLVYGLRNNEYNKKLYFSNDRRFSWVSARDMVILNIDDPDIMIESYKFKNGSIVEFKKKNNGWSRRLIYHNIIQRWRTFRQISLEINGHFMDNIYVSQNNLRMNLRSWREYIMINNKNSLNDC